MPPDKQYQWDNFSVKRNENGECPEKYKTYSFKDRK